MNKVQALQTMESPVATVPDDHVPQDSDRVDGDISVQHPTPQPWGGCEDVENPLEWSSWWKYSIIALVSFIELLTSVGTLVTTKHRD